MPKLAMHDMYMIAKWTMNLSWGVLHPTQDIYKEELSIHAEELCNDINRKMEEKRARGSKERGFIKGVVTLPNLSLLWMSTVMF